MKKQFNWKAGFGLILATLFAAPTTLLVYSLSAHAAEDGDHSAVEETRVEPKVEQGQRLNRVTPSTKPQPTKPNDGINRVLNPGLACTKTESNNNVDKGALYGGGAGLLLLGGPIGALVGAGVGAAVQQEQTWMPALKTNSH